MPASLSVLHAPPPRRRALAYLQGIVSSLERKNGWQLAEQAGEARPDGMQRLLNSASWDADQVRDDLRTYILEQLGDPQAILVIDETSFPKRGKKSAGVAKQYCGTTGQVENCQVGVFLAYASVKGHTLLDRELYLPLHWTQNRERRTEAGIPDTVRFQTKCELAQQMIQRLWKAQIPFAWVVADSVYGGNLDLRTWLEAHQYSYVLAVACDEPVGIRTADGRKQITVAEAEALSLHADDWQRLSMSEGTKGPRLFDWAVMPMLHRLLKWGSAIGARWHIEEAFETGKEIGLGDYEVRCWTAWYRHVTLVMIVQACRCRVSAQRLGYSPPSLPRTRKRRLPVHCFLSPFPKCVICSPTCSGLHLAVRNWCSLGLGGGAATRAVPVSSIPNVAVLRRNARWAPHGNPSSSVQHGLEFPGSFPWSSPGSFPCISREASSLFQKGVPFMTSLSVIDCCHMLAIDPKTLRQWLAQAQMSLHAHPTDARVKCLTCEQVHLLASLHGRVLQLPPEGLAPLGASPKPDEAESRMPTTSLPDVDLPERLVQMEAQVATLQAQLAYLALQLLQEREQRTEQRLLTLETQLTSTGEYALAPLTLPAPSVPCQPEMPFACHPTEKRARLIPLIEYTAKGSYVLICPKEGELHITPDSSEWFAWLASLSSFRFVGQSGRFSARRGYNHRPNRGWYAQRAIHQKNYSKYIGVSEHITTDRLEQIAAHFQSSMQ